MARECGKQLKQGAECIPSRARNLHKFAGCAIDNDASSMAVVSPILL